MTRIPLPDRRAGETFEVRHGALSFWVTVGFLPDGAPIEVFASMKGGRNSALSSDVEAIARDAGVLISIARQYGASMDTLRGAVTREESGAPASLLGAILDAMTEKTGEKT